jgi:CheY-specific phosphatase CheX
LLAEIDERTVVNASRQFWEQMLSMGVSVVPSSEESTLCAGHMVGSVALSGVWKGLIEVRMGIGLAYEATAAMMMQELGSVVEADALDATKEIANMIAGVIKSSLPRPCTMTVPESGLGSEAFEKGNAADDCLDVSFRHSSGDFFVRVREQEYMPEPMCRC